MAYSYNPEDLLQSFQTLKESFSVPENESVTTTTTQGAARTPLVVAATQITATGLSPSNLQGFLDRAETAIAMAASQGANLILLPELWMGPYFCQSQEASLMALADAVNDNNNLWIQRMQRLAQQYRVVLPVSIYERQHNAYYNSIVMIDADGSLLGTYRKSHIPDGTGYQEKFYFTPGDSGFKVFSTQVGRVGVAICWDQWFPEAARAMALQGADVLLYPTAIGSEPQDPELDSSDHWVRVMQGHAAANMVPVVASNRYGTEILMHKDGTEKQRIKFYGRSFLTDNTGKVVQECKDNSAESPVSVVVTEIKCEANRTERAAWGLFRDRRPELYKVLMTKDGTLP